MQINTVVIILPTYNERDNIEQIITAIQSQREFIPCSLKILVVDDNSPDGTAKVVKRLQNTQSNIHLLSGEKQGLGAAYIKGMTHAIDVLNADVVYEMDADFSHDPKDIPRLFKELEKGANFVIGSRYVEGGSIPKEWGLFRKLNSWLGNFVARYLAGIYRVRDCTAGFRAIRVSLLNEIQLKKLNVKGYAFQVSLLHEATLCDATIKEIPVHFTERQIGASKLGLSDIIEFIGNAAWIRFRTSKTFLKFAIVGASGVAVNLFSFSLFLNMGVNKFIASPLAIEVSIISNFLFNNYWTFRERKTNDRTRIKGLKFNIVSLLALAISYSTFIALSFAFPNTNPHIHQLIGILPATFINYFLNSYWTFKHV